MRLYCTNRPKCLLFAKNELMKFWLIAFGIFISVAAQAQFGFYAEGGGNYTDLNVTRNPGGVVKGKADYGWQVAVGTEYHAQFGYFLYVNVGVSKQSFGKDSSGTNEVISVASDYMYHPLFLNFPFGIGYQFDLPKQLAFRVYGGITAQTGIGGKLKRQASYYAVDTVTGEQTEILSVDEERKIHFGRSIQVQNEFRSDLANAIWGFNVGVGLNFSKSFEITAFYQGVFTNILPGGDGVPEINKLNSVSLNAKYYFTRSYYKHKPKY